MKTVIFYFIMLFAIFSASAQTTQDLSLEEKIRLSFSKLDKSEMQTDFLLDQGLHVAKPSDYNGLEYNYNQNEEANIGMMMYGGLLSSLENTSTHYPSSDKFQKSLNDYKDNGEFVVSIVNVEVDKIKQDLLKTGNLILDDGFIMQNEKSSISCFDKIDFIFPVTNFFETSMDEIEISFPNDLYVSNKSLPKALEVDFGNGFKKVDFDQKLIWEFETNGLHQLKIRITESNGETKILSTQINYKAPTFLEEVIKSYDSEPVLIDEDLGVEGLELYVYFNNNNPDCGEDRILKPLIFIEGFDPDNIIGVGAFDLIVDQNYGLPSGAATLRDELESGGYDLIFVNWKVAPYDCGDIPAYNNGSVSINENVTRIIQLIDWVNAEKAANQSDAENVVIGASMGGIVGKLALLKMEHTNTDHECNIFITIDSPLRGANIPLGLQAMVFDLYDLEILGFKLRDQEGVGESITAGYNTVNSPAAKEQLIYHYGARNIGLSTWSDAFYSQFDLYGDLKVEHIAITNGAQNGVGQLFNPGATLLDHEEDVNDNNSIFTALPDIFTNLHLFLRLYAYPGSPSKGVYERVMSYEAYIPFTINYDDTFNYHAPSGLLSLDAAPGGMRPFNRVAEGPTSAQGASGCEAPESLPMPFNFPSYCFVPTFSGLDSDVSNPFHDFTDPVNGQSSSDYFLGSFDNDFTWNDPDGTIINNLPQVNQEHVFPTGPNINFLAFSFMEDEAPSGILSNRTFNFGKGDQYLFDSSNDLVRRTTSRVIDQDLTVINNGFLYINLDGKIGYSTNSNALQSLEGDEFNVHIKGHCDSQPTELIIDEKGELVIGDADGSEKAKLTVGENTKIIVKDGGKVTINKNCKLILGYGGSLVVEAGGEVKVVGSGVLEVEDGALFEVQNSGKITTTSNGTIDISEEGKWIVEQGSKVSLNGHDSKAKIKGLWIVGGSFDFSGKGYFKVYPTCEFTLESDWEFQGSGKTTKAIELMDNVVLDLGENDFDIRSAKVKYGDNARIKMYANSILLSVHCTFEGDNEGTGFDLDGLERARLILCDFEGLNTGVQFGNGSSITFQMLYSNFNDCGISVLTSDVPRISTHSCKFTAGSSKSGIGLFIINATNVYSAGGEVSGYEGGQGYYLSNVSTYRSYGTNISNNQIGIFSPYDNPSNVLLMKGTVVENNNIGVLIEKGYSTQTETFGMVLADCAKFLNNTFGIQGEDIELQLDAITNCDECPIEQAAPNHFVGNSIHIDVCYVDKDNDELLLRGNYWGGSLPSSWSFDIDRADGSGGCVTPGSNILYQVEPMVTDESQSCNYNPGGTIGVGTPIEHPVKCFVKAGLTNETVKETYALAYSEFRNERYTSAKLGFDVISSTSNGARNNASYVCRNLIDVSRAIVKGYINDEYELALEDELKAYIEEKEEELELREANESTIEVYPNPAHDVVHMTGLEGVKVIQVMNLRGQIVEVMEVENQSISISPNWSSGLYFIQFIDLQEQIKEVKKLVVE